MDEGIRKRGSFIKTYKHLWGELLRNDTIRLAILKAAEGKTKNTKRHKELRYMRDHAEEFIPIARKWLIGYTPAAINRVSKTINDGIFAKKRNLLIPTTQEEVIINAVVIVLKKVLSPSMYEHSYASRPGKGTHKATKFVHK